MAYSADQLVSILESLNKDTFSNESDRIRVKDAVLAASVRLQTPFEIYESTVWHRLAANVIIKTLIDAGLWVKWVEAGGQPTSTADLAKLVDFDPVLLRRFLRHLTAVHLLEESEDNGDVYALTEYTRALAGPSFPYLYTWLFGMHQPNFSNFLKYGKETGYKNLTDPVKTNFANWYGEGETVFTLCAKEPHMADAFNRTLATYTGAKTPWVDVYPTHSIVESAKPGHALVVDVGGGLGQDIERFRAKHPDVPEGSLVLEDLPHVVEKSKVQSPIVTQAIDLFKPQPIIGARVYFLHTILHDWPEEKSVEILKILSHPLEKGYSRILLYEIIITERHPNPRATFSDFSMLMNFSAEERDEQTWKRIVEKAGLKVSKIWTLPGSLESVLEIELP